jgi:hypothetical protein
LDELGQAMLAASAAEQPEERLPVHERIFARRSQASGVCPAPRGVMPPKASIITLVTILVAASALQRERFECCQLTV